MAIKITAHEEHPDVKILSPDKFGDERGFFSEVYTAGLDEELNIDTPFVQDNHAYSKDAYVLRGLHYQSPPFAQDKLVRVTKGRILDVGVDIRHGSPTFGKWFSVELSASNWNQIFVPKGYAHGYVTLEEDTEVLYKVTNGYSPENDHGIAWDDPDLAIDWKLPKGIQAILSQKDTGHPTLKNADVHFNK